MKTKIGVLALVLALFAISCGKDETEEGPKTVVNKLDTLTVPTAFKQNILFEVFTGTWCGYCPELDLEVDEDLAANPGRMFAAMIHTGNDDFTIDEEQTLNNFFNITGVPTSIFNYNDLIYANYNNQLTKNPKSGVALGSTENTDGTVDVKVVVGFDETIDQRMQLGVYLVEDGITAPQQSYYDDDPDSPLFGQGSTLHNFTHNNVLRLVISENPLGDNIAASETMEGTKLTKEYSFTLDPSWDKDKLKIVAFVTDGVVRTSSVGNNYTFNANGAPLGEIALWH